MLLTQAESIIEEFVADILKSGDDDALFASGYLQGHLDLILQGCIDVDDSFDVFMSKMLTSLSGAYSKNELNPSDKQLVQLCWQSLQVKFAQR